MDRPPLLNDRYHLKGILGSGGMSVVYKAEDTMLERTVAIKVLREKYSSDPAFRERFRQEAKAAANLSHPNIVTIHDFGFDDKRLFIVMEYVPGETLKTQIEQRGRFTVEEAVPIIVQACAGVGYAHRAGLVHCDMKPHNVLVTPDGRVKVTDFGIARALSSIQSDEKSEIVWGSPQYFSPEQARGLAPSPSSDVYGLGVILFQMLTGQLPFHAENSVELAKMHRDLPPPAPVSINEQIPAPINDILLKVLAKEPSARYRTADQFGRVLQSFAAQNLSRSPSPEPAAPPAATRRSQPVRGTPPSSLQKQPPAPQPSSSPAFSTMERRSSGSVPAQSSGLGIDWINVLLGLIAILAVGGLVPFWIWVYYLLNGVGP